MSAGSAECVVSDASGTTAAKASPVRIPSMLRSLLSSLAVFAVLGSAAAASSLPIPRPPSVLSPDLPQGYVPHRPAPEGKPVPAPRTAGKAKKQRTRGLAKEFLPQIVRYSGSEAPGTIIIDTDARFLFLVTEGGKARRYGVGIGREGFSWTGVQAVSRKAEWPDWTPPPEMVVREAEHGNLLPASMPGGPENPLGARALYLGSTLYRIHGTTSPGPSAEPCLPAASACATRM